ncbi:MAG: Ig-like domain-containing protein [Candidatus Limimorpha sp.]
MKTRILSLMTLPLLAAVVLMSSCKKDSASDKNLITLSQNSVTLYHNDTYQIDASCKDNIAYSSHNEYVASVSNSGFVTAQYVGETNVSLKSNEDSKTFKVTVAPKSTLYPEPNIEIGESMASVLQKYPNAEIDDDCLFIDEYSPAAPELYIYFDDNRCVEDYDIWVESKHASELSTFIRERYKFLGVEEGIYVFINGLNENTATMGVYYEYSSYYDQYVVVYLPLFGKGLDTKALKASFDNMPKKMHN